MIWSAVAIMVAAGLAIGVWFVLKDRVPAPQIDFAELPSDAQFGLAAVLPVALDEPLAIAAGEDRLWVAASGSGALAELGPAGQQLATITVEPEGAPAAYPSDVALVGDRLATIDQAGTPRVVTMTTDGQDQRVLAEASGGNPTAIGADGERLLVAESSSGLIRSFDVQGAPGATLGAKVSPRLSFVGGLRADGGKVWVSDSNTKRVVAIDTATDKAGKKLPGPMGLPRGIDVDEFGRVYVADEFAGVVRVFSSGGEALGEVGGDETAGVEDGGRLEAPTDVAWFQGRLYVTDRQAGQVKVYNIRAP